VFPSGEGALELSEIAAPLTAEKYAVLEAAGRRRGLCWLSGQTRRVDVTT